jgi:hypothetical protein
MIYSPELAATICDQLAAGKSLRQICAAGGMPNRCTVGRWVVQHPEFREQYEAARLLWPMSCSKKSLISAHRPAALPRTQRRAGSIATRLSARYARKSEQKCGSVPACDPTNTATAPQLLARMAGT